MNNWLNELMNDVRGGKQQPVDERWHSRIFFGGGCHTEVLAIFKSGLLSMICISRIHTRLHGRAAGMWRPHRAVFQRQPTPGARAPSPPRAPRYFFWFPFFFFLYTECITHWKHTHTSKMVKTYREKCVRVRGKWQVITRNSNKQGRAGWDACQPVINIPPTSSGGSGRMPFHVLVCGYVRVHKFC